MIVKKILGLVVAIIMLFGVMTFSGCDWFSGRHKIYEDGYFQYIIIGENSPFPYNNYGKDAVVIVGFTEVGKELEIIDFPREIDGKPVVGIGYRDEGFYHNNSHTVYSEKLKKIYVHDNIKNIVYFDGSEVDMMVCSINYGSEMIFDISVPIKRIYIYKSLFEEANYSSDVFPANIAFFNNYSDEINGGYYRLDNIESGGKIPKPPDPERQGYQFTGWFAESECLNAWDFDNEPTLSANTEFRLYANWRAI